MARKTKVSTVSGNVKHAIEARFSGKFGLCLATFQQPIFGFDVIKFDRYVKTPNGISTADYVDKKYGPGAADLIREILNGEKLGGN